MGIEDILQKPVESIFNQRCSNALLCEEINNLNDFKHILKKEMEYDCDYNNLNRRKMIERFLFKIPNFGRKSLNHFLEVLEEHHITINHLFYEEEEKAKVSMNELIALQNSFVLTAQVTLAKINQICDQFHTAMDIQCKSHLTQLKIAMKQWEEKHK